MSRPKKTTPASKAVSAPVVDIIGAAIAGFNAHGAFGAMAAAGDSHFRHAVILRATLLGPLLAAQSQPPSDETLHALVDLVDRAARTIEAKVRTPKPAAAKSGGVGGGLGYL